MGRYAQALAGSRFRMLTVLVCVTTGSSRVSAQAPYTNQPNTIPYAQTFESYTNGTFLANTGGWFAADAEAAQVTTSAYADVYYGQLPFDPAVVAHTNVLRLDLAVTNVFGNAENLRPSPDDELKLWIDAMLQPTRWQEDAPPEVPDDAQMAMYVNSNGQLVAYCRYFVLNEGWHREWATMSHYPIQSNEWVRLTMQLWYKGSEDYDYFSLRLNGSEPVTHYYGSTTPGAVNSRNGSWFMCLDQPTHRLNSLSFSGTGYLDDLVVTNGEIVPIIPHTIVASAARGGTISPAGALPVTPGASPKFTFGASTGYNITNVAWGVGSGPDYQSNSLAYAVTFIGATSEYTFADVRTNCVIHVFTEPEKRTLRIVNAGEIGTPSPGVGDNPTEYDAVHTCSIAYDSPLNTWTTRHYCTWTRTNSTSSASDAGTSMTFTVQGGYTEDVTVVTWNWRLQNWLNTEATGTAGFVTGNGVVDVGDGWWNTGSVFTITATPENDAGIGTWDFDAWTGATNGCTISSNQITGAMDQPRTNITAHFRYLANPNTNWTLVVRYSEPYTNYVGESYGASPPVGTTVCQDGWVTNCAVTNSPVSVGDGLWTQLVCSGWTRISGRVPESGDSPTNTGVFMLTQDSEMTWNWTPQYWLQVVAGANGQVSGVTNGWRAANAEVAGILAVPHGRYEYVFSMWTGDVPAGSETSNPLSLTMNAARAVTALFAPAQKTSRGTPHPWIAQYYATNDYENCDGEDSDGDGRQTWQEYVTGTDPTDPSSVFRVVKVTLLNGSNRIDTYVTTNSGIFDPLSMYRSTELGLEWILVATNDIPRTSSTGTNTWWDVWPPTNARAFYRPAATNSTR